jgi:hypothetical protein
MSRVIVVLACGFSVAACSAALPGLSFTRSAPPADALRIESEPSGAEAKTSLGHSCRTPCELTVQGGGEFGVTLALAGFKSQTVSVRTEAPPPGPGPDPSPKPPRLTPNPLYVELQPAVAAPAQKRKSAPKTKPATATSEASSTPDWPPPPAASSPAPAPAPPPTMESAPSGTHYPWPSR